LVKRQSDRMEVPVVLYLANIIDYFRIIALYYATVQFYKGEVYMFAAFYLISYALDAFDGMAARALNQTSKLGLYLDMIIDRISSALCLHLAATKVIEDNPTVYGTFAAAGLYTALILVELVSHGVVMYKSELGGFHQKEMESNSKVVRLYLDDKRFLFFACASFEAFSLSVVLGQPVLSLISLPGFLFRSLANTLRLRDILAFRAPEEAKTKKAK